MRHYGIFVAYAPTVDLRQEGLGRYLAALLKGAANHEHLRFTIVCPSWSKETLEQLFSAEGVPQDRFEIRSPEGIPWVLRAYQAYVKRRRDALTPRRLLDWARRQKERFSEHIEKRLVQGHSLRSFLPLLWSTLVLTVAAIIIGPFVALAAILLTLGGLLRLGWVMGLRPYRHVTVRLQRALRRPKDDGFVLRLYKRMEAVESTRMMELVNEHLAHVGAWYAPTAFWPAFNKIRAPRLMCVPDVVLTEFPVGFSDVGGDRTLVALQDIEVAIRTGQHFVTYSEAIKWGTLVERYAVPSSRVSVIHHAPNDLSRWVALSGFDDREAISRQYCEKLLLNALRRTSNAEYSAGFRNASLKFLFYASQFRPNKNLLSLLRAYEHLLRKRLIGHKVILTGNPDHWPPVREFIAEHSLEKEVLCVHGLKVSELAACYKLADLAVNPSLSEGGCPFTFSEAVSVGTPVVMARIPVTEEILTDPALQESSFFDPFDWEDMANRIEWALQHREALLAIQRRTYEKLAQRSWTDVAGEHIEVLDQIASQGRTPDERSS